MANGFSFHEQFDRMESQRYSSDRNFCIVFSCCFALLACLKLRHGIALALLFGALSLGFAACALLRPSLAAPLNRLWHKLGLALASITNPLFLALIYYGAIMPMGYCMRLMGKDPMRRMPGATDSYWIQRMPPGPSPDSMPRQF